jgi:hypothetical protein
MKSIELFILVEGYFDKLFFETVIKPIFNGKKRAGNIKILECSNKTIERKRSMIAHNDYIFVSDKDENACITSVKEKIKNKFKRNDVEKIDKSKILIVVKEIESWYLAGLDGTKCHKLGIKELKNTDNITKEMFENSIPKRYKGNKQQFYLEILKAYSVRIAKSKNLSFRYFLEKYDLI